MENMLAEVLIIAKVRLEGNYPIRLHSNIGGGRGARLGGGAVLSAKGARLEVPEATRG